MNIYGNTALFPVKSLYFSSPKSNVLSFRATTEEIKAELNAKKPNGIYDIKYKDIMEQSGALGDLLQEKLTPVDDEATITARNKAAESFRTSIFSENFNTEEREHFKRKSVDELYNRDIKNRKYERKAEIVIGLAGAGKTTIVNSMVKNQGMLVIDGDITREAVPEYKEKAANRFYKEEQKEIELKLREKAVKDGANFVHVLFYREKTATPLRKIAQDLHKEGYKVNLSLVDLPLDKTATRLKARNETSGRFLDPLEIYCVGASPNKVFEELKKSKDFDGYTKYSTDVNRGEEPVIQDQIAFAGNKLSLIA